MSSTPFARPVAEWFEQTLGAPTPVQAQGWPALAAGRSALQLAPTGSGKTLAAFLAGIDRLMFKQRPESGVALLYVSPLKALAVDVERNLAKPISGISETATRLGIPFHAPTVSIRSGDTRAIDRARFRRSASDILITTPESLYLLLTSQAARHLATVETVIIDEVHALVGSKRGAHLALSLERLQHLCGERPLQRVGLSATVHPIEDTARFLCGAGRSAAGVLARRPLDVIDTIGPPRIDLSIEMPVEHLWRLAERGSDRSIWPALYGPLVELIRAHRSTLIFVNNRRLAERLSAALNELAGEPLVFAHHGAVARERRQQIEAALKDGHLRALVATSSLELGIDMGAIDLVVQIEAPTSVSSGLQRVGRAGHHVGGVSKAIIFPKYRGDLLAAAATSERMKAGAVEETTFPRNPLDVLCQQIVAIVSDGEISEDELYDLVRGAAPFNDLPRRAFTSVLDLLSGRYPSDEFAELKPRLVWDRAARRLSARAGARRVAVVNGGTIPDRGLYGVFLESAPGGRSVRVGELDEEMVFESRLGDVFVLGASSWRIEDIGLDRVLVSPAPGEPGRAPFWRGDRPGRPLELGRAIGRLTRELLSQDVESARRELEARGLREAAAQTLLGYLDEQRQAGVVPSDECIVIESFIDQLGDQRVCVLSPFGARVHAPWALACSELARERFGAELDAIWSDDGMVFRFTENSRPEPSVILPDAHALASLVEQSLGKSSLFSGSFRENAARALLLPRRRPGQRTPLWAQRRRSADLLRAAARYPDFPILLETYRECLRDVFDLPGLVEVLRAIAEGGIAVRFIESTTPSPFAATLLFAYAGNFIYESDAPLAERRAHALTIDQAQLLELLGEAELRELLDPEVIQELAREVAGKTRLIRNADDLHDRLIAVGDLERGEIRERLADVTALDGLLDTLLRTGRAIAVDIGGVTRIAASEDAARLRDALGVSLPDSVPSALLEPVREPLLDLVARYARTHGPFTSADVAARYAVPEPKIAAALASLAERGRVTSGQFLPHGHGVEWCDLDVLRRMRQQSLARLRRAVEPVEPPAYARFMVEWQGLAHRRSGVAALAAALDQLEGAPVVASVLEREILPARVDRYRPADLDALTSSGEFVWRALEPLGTNDARIAFYRAERVSLLAPVRARAEGELAAKVRETLEHRGASFFWELVSSTRAFPRDVLAALFTLVFAGEVTNDTLAPLRSRLEQAAARESSRHPRHRRRTETLPGSEGRWSLVERFRSEPTASATERLTAIADTLLDRYGVLVREQLEVEAMTSFGAIYPVLKALEEAGKIRRGYFVAGLAATQFARAGADDRLRLLRASDANPKAVVLAATDPGNPYGAGLPWPDTGAGLARAAGAKVVLFDGALLAYLARGEQSLRAFLPSDADERRRAENALIEALTSLVDGVRRRALLITELDGAPARESPLGVVLERGGFNPTSDGYQYRAVRARD